MAEIRGKSMDEVFDRLLRQLLYNPRSVCSPRGQKVKERLAVTFELTDPTRRVVWNPARETNHGFACGEFLWYWQGRQDLEMMLFYNKRMKDFSDDGKTLNSAYGYRMKKEGSDELFFDQSQWKVAIRELVRDPDSRRAVLTINRPMDLRRADLDGSKDVPCTLSLQFFIRDGKLDLHAVMRSNDVMWGLTYDAFSFTMFQECMLLELKEWEKFKDLKLGSYFHTAGSMHIYERHWEQAEKMLDIFAPDKDGVLFSGITGLEDLDRLGGEEERIRTEGRAVNVDSYSGTLRWMAEQLNANRLKRLEEKR